MGREIIARDGMSGAVEVATADAALLCEEAQLAIAAGLSEEARGAILAEMALLEVGLRTLLGELEPPTTA